MKTFSFVLAALVTIVLALPSVASAREGKHHHGMMGKHHGMMGHGKPHGLRHRMHDHLKG